MKKGLIQKSIVLVFFTFLFILGIYLFKDYGISTDEPRERETTFLNLNYVLETVKIRLEAKTSKITEINIMV